MTTNSLFTVSEHLQAIEYPWLINPSGALRRFRENYIARAKGSPVRVAGIGDSVIKGSGSSNYLRRSMFRMVGHNVMAALNPAGIGSFGFIHVADGGSTYGSHDLSSSDPLRVSMVNTTASYLTYTDNGDGIGARRVLIDNNGDADTQKVTFFAMDNSTATIASMRDAHDAFCVLYQTDPAFGTISVDGAGTTGTTPSRGGGTPTGSIATNTTASYGNCSAAYTVSNSFADNRIALRPPTTSTTQVCVEGISLHKGGSHRSYVEFDDYSNAGSRLSDWTANALTATITNRSKLYNPVNDYQEGVIGTSLFCISDVINVVTSISTGGDLSTHRQGWINVMESIGDTDTGAGALWLIPPMPTLYDTAVERAAWSAVIAEIESVVKTSAYKDFASMLVYPVIPGLETSTNSDNTHPGDEQYARMAHPLATVLTECVR